MVELRTVEISPLNGIPASLRRVVEDQSPNCLGLLAKNGAKTPFFTQKPKVIFSTLCKSLKSRRLCNLTVWSFPRTIGYVYEAVSHAGSERLSLDDILPFIKRVAECLYRRHTGVYYAFVKHNGKQFRRSLKTKDRQLAERRLKDFRAKAGRLGNLTRDRGLTFIELAKDWFDAAKTRVKPSSARSLDLSIRQLNKHFGVFAVRSITTAECHNWEKHRGAGISASTFNHDRSALVAILNYAVQEGLLMENPALTIAHRKLPKYKLVVPSKAQFHLLVKTIHAAGKRARHGAALVQLLGYSGMRLSEATALTWGDIDFERGQFSVTGGAKGTKNHEARAVPLFPAMRSLLETVRNGEQPSLDARVIQTGHARKAIENACARAKLPHFHHHLFRHFFVSQAIEVGVDFKTVAAWVGHKDGGVLVAKTYGHLSDVHSFEMGRKMTFSIGHAPDPMPANIIPLGPLESGHVPQFAENRSLVPVQSGDSALPPQETGQ